MMHNGPDKCNVHTCIPNTDVVSCISPEVLQSPATAAQTCLPAKEGGPALNARCNEGLPSRQTEPTSKADTGYLQGSEGLPAMQRAPTFQAEKAYLQGREGLVFGVASTSSQNLHLSCSMLQLSLQSCQGKLVLLFCPVLPLLVVLNLSVQCLDL